MDLFYWFLQASLWYFLTIGVLQLLGTRIVLADFLAVCVAAYGCIVVCSSYGLVASLILLPFGKRGIVQYLVARGFKWTMYIATGCWFDIVSGAEYLYMTTPAVFIANHQTELDVLMLGHVFPKWCSVTAKKSLARTPILGWFMTMSGTVFLDRANRSTAVMAIQGAARQIKERKQKVFMFVEGTRTYSDKPMMLPIKKGAFHLAIQAGVPILPVVVENYAHRLSFKRFHYTPGSIRIRVLPPISTEGLTTADVNGLVESVSQSMLENLLDMYKTRDEYALSRGEPPVPDFVKTLPSSVPIPASLASSSPSSSQQEQRHTYLAENDQLAFKASMVVTGATTSMTSSTTKVEAKEKENEPLVDDNLAAYPSERPDTNELLDAPVPRNARIEI